MSIESKRTTDHRRAFAETYVATIRDNVADWVADRIDDDEFHRRQVQVWTIAKFTGTTDVVRELLEVAR